MADDAIDYLNRKIEKEDNRGYLEIIDKNLTRLTHLVSDLFDFTKLEAKTSEWDFAQENLTILIQEVIEIISPLVIENKISINYENEIKEVIKEFDFQVDSFLENYDWNVYINLLKNPNKPLEIK